MNRNEKITNGTQHATHRKTCACFSMGALSMSALLAGALLSAPVMADASKNQLFGGSCSEISRDIHQLMQFNPNSPVSYTHLTLPTNREV